MNMTTRTKLQVKDLVRAVERDRGGRWTDEVGTVIEAEDGTKCFTVRWTNGEETWEDRDDLERVAVTKLPRELRRSYDFGVDPAGTLRLWDRGYRPVEASKLRSGDEVAYVTTDPLLGNPMGAPKFSRVIEVRHEEHGTLTVEHTGGTTEVDDGETVWVKS